MKVGSRSLGTSIARGLAVLCAAVFGTSARPVRAGINVWTRHGPGYVDVSVLPVNAIAVDPSTPSTLYAAASRGVFKSIDGASTWRETGLSGTDVTMLDIDPSLPTTLYAAGYGGVFRSADGGGTWVDIGLGLGGVVQAFAIDPTAPGTLYAAPSPGCSDRLLVCTGGGVFKSTDGGGSWHALDAGLRDGVGVNALAVDPSTPGTLYAAASGSGVMKSTDGGRSWQDTGLRPGTDIRALAIDPTTPTTLYADGLFKSIDGGGSWNAVNLPAVPVFDPLTPGTLYAAGYGVMKSTDGGSTWQETGLGHLYVYGLAVDPGTPGTLYAVGEGGAYKSTDGASTWAAVDVGLPVDTNYYGKWVSALAIDPGAPGTIYAAGNGGVYRSTDGASSTLSSWQSVNVGLPADAHVDTLTIDPTTPDTLYAGVFNGGVFRSTDGAMSWQFAGSSTAAVLALAIDPTAPGTLYAAPSPGCDDACTGGGVRKSTDGGASWQVVNTGLSYPYYVGALAIDAAAPDTLYAGTSPRCDRSGTCTGGGVFKSTDGASTWQAVSTGLAYPYGVNALAIDPNTPDTLYAGTSPRCDPDSPDCPGGGVYKSTDGASTWQETGLPPGSEVIALAIDPTSPRTLYAATRLCHDNGCDGGGVYKSTDGAASWQSLPGIDAIALAIDPSTPGRLYAATSGGVFSLQQGVCSGDCDATGIVTVGELITLVNIALGSALAPACPNGIPSSVAVDIALLVRAVSNALTDCGSGQ